MKWICNIMQKEVQINIMQLINDKTENMFDKSIDLYIDF